ncbi:hypothetical protein [Streptomyces canus]|uniref:hypothetical protein n=1 Tax=Streptomyces canus TaxID=58343 RepID=UPI002E2745F7
MTPGPGTSAPADFVAAWLLDAAMWGPERAREEWETAGMTPLRAGGSFCALRVPVALVEAAAADTDPATVDAYLGNVLDRAPAFRCNTGRWFYVLVRPTVASWWDSGGEVECVGEGHEIGVPRLDLVEHPGRTASYWAVPMTRPSQLGTGQGVSQMVTAARSVMAKQEGTP